MIELLSRLSAVSVQEFAPFAFRIYDSYLFHFMNGSILMAGRAFVNAKCCPEGSGQHLLRMAKVVSIV
jgi:hypothetical protein